MLNQVGNVEPFCSIVCRSQSVLPKPPTTPPPTVSVLFVETSPLHFSLCELYSSLLHLSLVLSTWFIAVISLLRRAAPLTFAPLRAVIDDSFRQCATVTALRFIPFTISAFFFFFFLLPQIRLQPKPNLPHRILFFLLLACRPSPAQQWGLSSFITPGSKKKKMWTFIFLRVKQKHSRFCTRIQKSDHRCVFMRRDEEVVHHQPKTAHQLHCRWKPLSVFRLRSTPRLPWCSW